HERHPRVLRSIKSFGPLMMHPVSGKAYAGEEVVLNRPPAISEEQINAPGPVQRLKHRYECLLGRGIRVTNDGQKAPKRAAVALHHPARGCRVLMLAGC